MTGFKNRFITVLQWALTFIGKGRSERTLTLQQAVARVAIEEAGGRPFLLRITAEDAPDRGARPPEAKPPESS
jgi:NADH dehydrogenase